MKHLLRLVFLGGFSLMAWMSVPPGTVGGAEAKAKTATPEQIAFFEKNIRPVLVKECYACHATTAKKIRGGLTLDTRDGFRKGGDTGPALVPGDPQIACLSRRSDTRTTNSRCRRRRSFRDEVIADFEKWIALGAADPRGGAVKVVARTRSISRRAGTSGPSSHRSEDAAAGRQGRGLAAERHRPLSAGRVGSEGTEARRPTPTRGRCSAAFTFDLTGLPPTPEEVEAFVTEYAASSRRDAGGGRRPLLASPRFGERWGRHWLDVARYAESSGRADNFAYPHAWRYRDYVIAAFNADKPYDQFIREQLAGDLLDARDDKQKAEFLIATGFLAIGPKTHNERNRRAVPDGPGRRADRRDLPGLPGTDGGLRPLPRSQVRSDPAEGLLRPGGHLPQHRRPATAPPHHPEQPPQPPDGLAERGRRDGPLEPLTAERRAGSRSRSKDTRRAAAKVTGQNAFMQRIFLQHRDDPCWQSQLGSVRIRRHAETPGDGRARALPSLRTAGSTSAANSINRAKRSSAASRRC